MHVHLRGEGVCVSNAKELRLGTPCGLDGAVRAHKQVVESLVVILGHKRIMRPGGPRCLQRGTVRLLSLPRLRATWATGDH